MFLRGIVVLMFAVLLTGCATTQKPTAMNQLEIRVAQIETQLDEQDQDVTELKYAVETLTSNVEQMSSSPRSVQRSSTSLSESLSGASTGTQQILRVAATPQEVQEALKSAGYYDGAIDGKLGSGSQRAIKAFQKDHGLESDGIIGQKTWTELKNYIK
jgi:peptidoglycan hydrolase-like protein with peptidoglycan-binding domain